MIKCDERQKLRRQLDEAFQEWYAVKDTHGRENEEAARKAERKVHHLSRNLTDHCVKHRCTRDEK